MGLTWVRIGLWLLAAASAAVPAGPGEAVRVPLTLRDGLLYVPVRLLGCAEESEVELLLDTGAGTTILPHGPVRHLHLQGSALDLGRVRVELADGAPSEAREYLVDGLRLGTCEILGVRGLTCSDQQRPWAPVLGMDVLQRLGDLVIRVRPGGGELQFTCPTSPSPSVDECAPP